MYQADGSDQASFDDAAMVNNAERLTSFLVVVGYGCLCAWELTFMFLPMSPLMGFAGAVRAVELYLVALASCTAVALLLWGKADAVLDCRRRLLPMGAAMILCALAAFAALSFGGAVFPVVELMAAVLLGGGQALLLVLWGAYLSLVPPGRTAWSIAVGSVVGTALFVLTINLDSVVLNLLGTAFVVLVSAVSAVVLASTLPEGSILPVDRYDKAPPLSKPSLFSAALNCVAYGFVLVALFSFGFFAALLGAVSGAVGIVLSLLWRRLLAQRDLEMTTVQHVVLPVIVSGLLLMPFFQETGQIVCCCIINAAHAFYRTTGTEAIASATREFQLQPVRQAAFGRMPILAGWTLGALLGLVIFFLLDLSGVSFAFAVTLVVIAINAAVAAHDLFSTNANELVRAHLIVEGSFDAVSAPSDASSEEGCAALAGRFGLSPRESEVFAYLVRGRNAEYIQNKLTLAPGTVKTHIYHIYQKTGVSSQQRLMDLAEQEAGDCGLG